MWSTKDNLMSLTLVIEYIVEGEVHICAFGVKSDI